MTAIDEARVNDGVEAQRERKRRVEPRVDEEPRGPDGAEPARDVPRIRPRATGF